MVDELDELLAPPAALVAPGAAPLRALIVGTPPAGAPAAAPAVLLVAAAPAVLLVAAAPAVLLVAPAAAVVAAAAVTLVAFPAAPGCEEEMGLDVLKDERWE